MRKHFRLPPMPPGEMAAIIRMVRAGFHRWAVAREHHLSVDEVSEVLRRNGIRPHGPRTPPAARAGRTT